MFSAAERAYVAEARIARLATADTAGRPSVIPICYAFVGDRRLGSAIDEKPQRAEPAELRRVRDITENPHVALVVDHYREDWDRLGWVQIKGSASLIEPGDDHHATAVAALRGKYDQYADHDLAARPIILIDPGTVRSWGSLGRA